MVTNLRVDVRGKPLDERIVMYTQAFEQLAPGDMMTVFTEYDPRAFAARTDQQWPRQAVCRYQRVGPDDWTLEVTRWDPTTGEPSIAWLFERCMTFADLSDEIRADLVAHAVEYNVRKGEVLDVGESETAAAIGVVWEGVLAITTGNGMRERMLYELFPLETFGEIRFFGGGQPIGRYIVLSKIARYVLIPNARVHIVAQRYPELYAALGAACAQHARALAAALSAQVSLPIIARIASALIPFASPDPGLNPGFPPLASMTQGQLALAAGTVKEVAARAIAELESRGALRRERGHIRYLDRARLLEVLEKPGESGGGG